MNAQIFTPEGILCVKEVATDRDLIAIPFNNVICSMNTQFTGPA